MTSAPPACAAQKRPPQTTTIHDLRDNDDRCDHCNGRTNKSITPCYCYIATETVHHFEARSNAPLIPAIEGTKDIGHVTCEKWPSLLEPILQRLDQIVHNDFPIPTIPPADWLRPRQQKDSPEHHANTAEAAETGSPTHQSRAVQRPLPPVPPFNSSTSTNASHVPDSVPASQTPRTAEVSVPELLIQQLGSISLTLRTDFAAGPPHTIQRLAELVLTPTKHYRTLPAWLRAVDRAVSVTSAASIFPLAEVQPAHHDSAPETGLSNGMTDQIGTGASSAAGSSASLDTRDVGLGSDESLGGALLTPIPWLKNGETAATASPKSESSYPVDSLVHNFVPEREDGAVTQGELIRMEQEAGIVPISQTAMADGQGELEGEVERTDLVPHARGPDVVGVEDMGLQDGKGLELQIGVAEPRADQAANDAARSTVGPEALAGAREQGGARQEKARPDDSDDDLVLADADGRTELVDSNVDEGGEK